MSGQENTERVVYWDDLGFAVRLSWDPLETKPYWINWKLYEIFPVDDGSGMRLFVINGASPMEGTIDEADHCGDGFCKWDACFQGDLNVHFDQRKDMANLHEALERIYDEIRSEMDSRLTLIEQRP